MDRNRKPKINESYTAEKFDDELIIYSEEGEKGLYLNNTAQAVLQLCSEKLTVAQIIEFFQQHYPDQKEEVDSNVVEALSTLESNGVITYLHE